jgi:hypothetical protein
MTNKLKLDVNNFDHVKKDMNRIEKTLKRIEMYENYKKVLDDIAIKALENEDAEVKMNLNVQITKKQLECVKGEESPKQILDRIKSADSAESFMKAIGDIEKVLDGNSIAAHKDNGFSINTDITNLSNVAFLSILEGMQIVLEKQIKKLKISVGKK